ncbi:FYVE zinc finger [Colletotrichum graminicola M1.001]|uniref:FYVE zinc finger n=1 Tax=Colletotrichum graminicola (strain M1.001 / M2 / FGSC 10212) TaxID=645133 RepID=E3QSE6_COLGM|nr:FYVE zinc finger [Colletotrichum graminicola M1.001]EFQ33773.1 FYVE zinc finger [Colletotrichum graminicola M1.001]
MSGRKLGGGRILGSGKGLAPPTPPAVQGHRRTPSPFAPSESTLSINSSSASPPVSSPLPDFAQDLASNVSLGGPSTTAAQSSKLVCPICDDEMLTLLQLNRHIDDNHQELPEIEQDEVRTWFDKQVLKAKRFQPLSIINQKLRGLDVFESNESMPIAAPTVTKLVEGPMDPDELITRSHWQRQTSNDRCTDPTCPKGLGAVNGSINCRNCGRLFCEEHTMYQMRLSRAAKHDPVRGYWVRVCETCYKSRDGYNDHNGVLVDHTSAFTEIRRKRVERQNLEVARLEKRLTKLTQLLANAPQDATANGGGNLLAPVATLTGQKNQRKLLEQSVVTWEDDASVTQCPFCQQEFGSWTFRRHHCRICGRVVCADPLTGCSSEVGLSIANPTNPATEKPPTTAQPGQLSIDVRMCRECNHTIFSKRDFAATLSYKPPDQRAYETLRQFERGIRQLMPIFQRTLLALQPESEDGSELSRPPPTHAQIQEASKIRKRLTDAFTKYDMAARRLRDMKTKSKTQLRLQQAVYAAASSFLHTHMLTLKSVPQILRSRSSQASRLRTLQSGSINGSSSSLHLSPLRNQELAESETASQASETSTAVSALETEEKEARERLVVLEEQRFMVQQMVDNARDARRFEEVSALTRNVEELDREIEKAKKNVGGVEERWEGLYASGLAR